MSREQGRGYLLLVLLVYCGLYLLPLGARPLFVPDETRYGEVPREMIASGDWVVPRINGLDYFEKPVLGYWLNGLSIMAFGHNRFAVRLPSALAAGLSGLLVFTLVAAVGRRSGRAGPREGALAALVFLTCFEVAAVGTFAVLDSMLSLFLTASLTAWFFASEAGVGSGRQKILLVLAGASCGLAFLTKGFLALAVPVLVIGPYLLWQRRYRDLWQLCWLPLLVAILVALPWSVLIQRRAPDFWRFFFWNEHVRRFFSDHAQHRKSFWFFFLTAPAMFLPWTLVLPAAVGPARRMARDSSPMGNLVRFALCWLVVPFLFFSVSNGKLLTYILPCFPPFAILVALGLVRGISRGRQRWFNLGVAAAATLFACLLLGFLFLQFHGYHGFHPYSRTWKWLMAANGMAFFLLACLWVFLAGDSREKVLRFGLAPVLLLASLHFIMPDLTIEKKAPGALLERHRRDLTPETILISGEEPLRAVCWYFQRDDVYMLEGVGELRYGLEHDDAVHRLLTVAAAARLIRSHPGRVILVARARNFRRYRDRLPEPRVMDDNGRDGYVLLRY